MRRSSVSDFFYLNRDVDDDITATFSKLRAILHEEAIVRKTLEGLFIKQKEEAEESVRRAHEHLAAVYAEQANMRDIIRRESMKASEESMAASTSSLGHLVATEDCQDSVRKGKDQDSAFDHTHTKQGQAFADHNGKMYVDCENLGLQAATYPVSESESTSVFSEQNLITTTPSKRSKKRRGVKSKRHSPTEVLTPVKPLFHTDDEVHEFMDKDIHEDESRLAGMQLEVGGKQVAQEKARAAAEQAESERRGRLIQERLQAQIERLKGNIEKVTAWL
ncbi:hypothetical protein M408DRAFT_334095, partial [Serendipita vermifera MAFF 305830]